MNDATLRQWAMLKLLPRSPDSISTVELLERLRTQGFTVSIRTIQRDLNSLSLAFPLVGDESKPQGWSWTRGAPQIEFPALNVQTALTFVLAQSMLDQSLPAATVNYLRPWFSAAKEKLVDSAHPDKLVKNKFRIVSRMPSLTPPLIDSDVQESVYRGVLSNLQIAIHYQSRQAKQEKRYIVHPLGVVIIDSVCYLICTFSSYEDVRVLALHRIKSAKILDSPSIRPKKFNLDDYINTGSLGILRGQESISIEFLMNKKWAYHLYETPLAANQKIQELKGDWAKISAIVPDTSQIRWWLRSFGSDVQVLQPARLRDEFCVESEKLNKLYQLNSMKQKRKIAISNQPSRLTDEKSLRSWEEAVYKNDYQDTLSTEDCVLAAFDKLKEQEKSGG
ncbi:MAG: WYL domain-containing protein [Bdellovibrionales bacterium]|nr:WYL domain-containing protein [Bdellovibrionales bacterium]